MRGAKFHQPPQQGGGGGEGEGAGGGDADPNRRIGRRGPFEARLG